MASNQPVAEPASTISRILKESQICATSQHPTLIQELVDCRRQHPGFFQLWESRLQPLFLVGAHKPAVEQAMHFCAQVVVYQDSKKGECDEFAERCLQIFLKWSGAVDRVVRYRATQMVHEVMQKIPEDALVDDLVDAVVEHMLLRMQDKSAAVRALAARSLWRIAVATDPDALESGGIIEHYRKILYFDEIADVRKTVVTLMPAISSTVADVAARTADTHESVRRAAFVKLGSDFPLNSLSISQRASVLGRGLQDRVPAVKAACFRMLKHSWLMRDCGGDVLSLLKLVDVETHFKVAETIMAELLVAGVVHVTDDSSVMPFFRTDESGKCQLLEAEEALYWRAVCQFLHDEQQARSSAAAMSVGVKAVVDAENANAKQDAFEKILPSSVADYVRLIEQHIDAGQHYQFTCQQLLKLAKLLDFTDTSSRKVAGVFLQNLLLAGTDFSENDEHVGDGISIAGDKEWEEAIVEFGKSVYAIPGEWIKVMIDLVDKLGRPCREGGADPMQWLKCLAMAGLLLQDMVSTCQLVGSVIEPTELVDALLLSAVKHIHTEVQRAGLRCLGLFCHLEEKPSPRIVQAMQSALFSPQQPVRNMAVKAMFDLIICHGAGCIDEAEISNQLASEPGNNIKGQHLGMPMMDILSCWLDVDASNEEADEDKSALLDSDNTTAIVAEGFAKLLIRSKTREMIPEQDAILRKLLLHYFNIKTADYPRTNQCLTIFFQNYTAVSAEHKRCVSRVFVPVVRCTWVGEGNSAATRERSKLLSQFMLQLMVQPIKKRSEQQQTDDFSEVRSEVDNGAPDEGHEILAILIGTEVSVALQQPKFPAPRPYAGLLYRVVSCLQFRETQQEKIKYMQSVVGSTLEFLLSDKIQPKTLIQQLRGLSQRLRALDHTPDTALTDEELALLTETLLPSVVPAEDGEVRQAPASEPRTARRKTAARKKKKRVTSPADSETSSPEIYTPVRRDRRRGRVLEL